MTRTFDCGMCLPGCRLSTDEDDIELPDACPWSRGESTPKWTEDTE